MKIIGLISIVFTFFLMSGCGEKMQELQQTAENLQNVSDAAKQVSQNVDLAEQKRQERIKKGDTLAIHFEKLQEYLPASISGYTAKEPEGQSMNMGEFSFSTVSREYTKPGKDGMEDYIKIELVDYNQAGALYSGMTIWAAGFKFESKEKLEQTYDPGIQNVVAFESFDKIQKEVKITYGIAWRFILSITATNQSSSDFAKQVVSNMKVKELANM